MSSIAVQGLRGPSARFSEMPPVQQGRLLGRLARHAAQEFGLRPKAIRNVREGFCTTFRVVDESLRVYALKVGRVGTETVETLGLEADLVSHLHKRGLSVPEVARTPAGTRIVVAEEVDAGTRPCILYTWLRGRRQLGHMTPAVARALGRLLGRIHTAAETFLAAPCDRKTWRVRQMCGWWRGPDPIEGNVSAAVLADIRAWERHIQGIWRRTQRDRNSWGLVLADVGPHNVLWRTGTPWLVDFNDTGWGLLGYDLAVLWHSVVDRDLTSGEDVIAGYASVRDLPPGWGPEMQAAATLRVLRHRTARGRDTAQCVRRLRELSDR